MAPPHLRPTRLNPPPVRARLVTRRHLLERLAMVRRHTVTLLAAPAGFGKTTLLVAWEAEVATRLQVAWVSLEPGDADPIRFWTCVLTALQARRPGLGVAAQTLLQGAQPAAIEAFLDALLRELDAIPEPLVLVLDDYHVVQSPVVHAGLRYLLERLPAGMHLLLSTRSDPPLPLARLRANDQLLELRAADLRFSRDEASEFLRAVMGLELTDEQVAALGTRTEGWAAGLQLAGLSLRDRADASTAIASFTGSHRFVIDYLVEEVLTRLPDATRVFLERTSMLGRLTGALCDAVTGGSDSAGMLEELERANLFVSALDDGRHWYRYHQLLADGLRHQLQRRSPELLCELHDRASRWFEANGLVEEAVEHALASGSWDRAASLIAPLARVLISRGEQSTLRRWMTAVPADVRCTHPLLSGAFASSLLLMGDFATLQHFLDAAEPALEAMGARVPLGNILATHAYLVVIQEDQARAEACAERALALLPPGEVHRVTALLARSVVSLDRGELAAAERTLGQLSGEPQAASSPLARWQLRSLRARLELLRGRLARAAALQRQVVEEVGPRRVYPRQVALLDLAAVAYEWNQLDDAIGWLDQLPAAQTHPNRGIVLPRYHLQRARLLRASGQPGAAEEALQQALTAARGEGLRRPERLVHAERARLLLALGDVEDAARWADHFLEEVDDVEVFEHEPETLTLVRVRLAQGRAGQIVALLHRLLATAEAAGRMCSAAELLGLLALADRQAGELPASLASIERALALAEAQGSMRIFVDEGEPMASLLRQALAQRIRPSYVGRLLRCFEGTVRPAASVLTPREHEVLRLIALGLSNRDIADRLVLSEGTVKSHVHNLIGKLGAESRTQVLARAREIGVLDLANVR
ncbi:MAG: AAA family ATPase [Chloroflexi bacterium]|nr:AAA family ATPase [Chloroflexota bacterium]